MCRSGFSLLLGLLLLPTVAHAGWFARDASIMGTAVRVEVAADSQSVADAHIDTALNELRRIDARMSPYREESELSAINREAAQHPVAVSRELVQLLARALALSEQTDGAFDITFASVGFQYDYRNGRRPDNRTLAELLPSINFRHVVLNPQTGTVAFRKPGVKIDLGGIAKGYAVENAAALLASRGVRSAVVTAGGDTRVLGDRDGRPWVLGIRHPRAERKIVTRLPLINEAISTSGDYERYFEENGVRYHHIINPATGDSAREVVSATVIGADATLTDGLSTSLFVLGATRGLALINRLPGYEAVVVDSRGELHFSEGLAPP